MRNISEEERQRIENLLSKEIVELYMLIAQTDPAYSDVFFTPREAYTKGQESMNRLSKQLYQKICVEWNYCHRRHDTDLSDNMLLVAGVSDLILGIVGEIPATIIAVLIIKKGLNRFCKCGNE